jgi:hypothetical protein
LMTPAADVYHATAAVTVRPVCNIAYGWRSYG